MTLDDVTAEWLTHALRADGADVVVGSVQPGAFIGGAASKIRLHIDYDKRPPGLDLPNTMVLKICLEAGREALMEAGFYHREAYFYKNIRDKYGVRSPRYYFAAEQRGPDQAAILLEDLAQPGVRFGSALRPYTHHQVASALGALAELHARSMNDQQLQHMGMPVAMEDSTDIFENIIRNAESLFKTPRGFSVPVALHDPVRLRAGYQEYKHLIQNHKTCLLHGDAHVGNTYVGPDGEVHWLDWQLAGIGHWIHDVTYFMGCALDMPDRRRHEQELLKHYLTVAETHGGRMPDFREAWRLYRCALFYGFIVWLGTDAAYQPEDIDTACLSRFGVAMIDHDVYEILGV